MTRIRGRRTGGFNPYAGTYNALFGKSDDVALYLAVIQQHIEDAAMSYPAGAGGKNRADRIRQEARAWLLEPNAGFEEVCALAGVEPRDVRNAARAKIEAFDRQRPEAMRRATRRPRPAKLYKIDGVSKTLAEWADSAGMSASALKRRIKRGATLAEALAKPPVERARGRLYEIDGEAKTLTEWATVAGISVATLVKRLARGASIEEALTP